MLHGAITRDYATHVPHLNVVLDMVMWNTITCSRTSAQRNRPFTLLQPSCYQRSHYHCHYRWSCYYWNYHCCYCLSWKSSRMTDSLDLCLAPRHLRQL